MGFGWTENETHGYHLLESECAYDGLLVRNKLFLQITPICYIKQTVPSIIRVTWWHGVQPCCDQRSTKYDFQPSKSLFTKSSGPEILLLMPMYFFLNIAFFSHYLFERASLLSLKKLVGWQMRLVVRWKMQLFVLIWKSSAIHQLYRSQSLLLMMWSLLFRITWIWSRIHMKI